MSVYVELIEFWMPEEAISKVGLYLDKLRAHSVSKLNSALLAVFKQVLKAHISVLKDSLEIRPQCPIPVNSRTGFPDAPTLVADARYHSQNLGNRLGLMLKSFGSWMPWLSETVKGCCCGRRQRIRDVKLETMLHHHLFNDPDDQAGLILQVLGGVKSEDASHLEHHYRGQNGQTWARATDQGVVVTVFGQGKINRLSDGEIEIRVTKDEGADFFKREVFYKTLAEV